MYDVILDYWYLGSDYYWDRHRRTNSIYRASPGGPGTKDYFVLADAQRM